MPVYELPLVIKPLLPDDVRDKVVASIEETVKKMGGSLETTQVWGKKHLAYPIKGHEEGYYIFFKLVLDADKVKQLEKTIKLIPDVLRFLIISEENL